MDRARPASGDRGGGRLTRAPLFPVFLHLEGRPAFLLGRGEAADRRHGSLVRAGAILRHEPERFDPAALDGCAIAIGAEAAEVELRALYETARRIGIPVNVVDRPDLSTFITPAVVERLPLQLAIASAGTAPVLARLLRARIETLVDPGYGRLAALADRLKTETRRRLPDVVRRRRMLERALGGRAAALMLAGDEAGAERAYRDEMRRAEQGAAVPERGLVHLVHSGPGDADLLTLRALRVLGEADVIVHAPDESRSVLEVARRDASRIVVAGPQGPLLVTLGREGRLAVRLRPCPGEREMLQDAGVAVTDVPGVDWIR